jgi:hypothetical protein
LSVKSKRVPPNHLKTYEAIQRYYGWALSQKPEGFPQVLEALKHAASLGQLGRYQKGKRAYEDKIMHWLPSF